MQNLIYNQRQTWDTFQGINKFTSFLIALNLCRKHLLLMGLFGSSYKENKNQIKELQTILQEILHVNKSSKNAINSLD